MTTKKEKISGGVPKNPVMKYLYHSGRSTGNLSRIWISDRI